MNDTNDQPQRPMVQGNWTCSSCGTEITELPFEPREGQAVTCRDCYRKNRPARPGGNFGGQRQTHQGDWKCSNCGAPVTELPFKPSGDRPIYCRDCFRKNRE